MLIVTYHHQDIAVLRCYWQLRLCHHLILLIVSPFILILSLVSSNAFLNISPEWTLNKKGNKIQFCRILLLISIFSVNMLSLCLIVSSKDLRYLVSLWSMSVLCRIFISCLCFMLLNVLAKLIKHRSAFLITCSLVSVSVSWRWSFSCTQGLFKAQLWFADICFALFVDSGVYNFDKNFSSMVDYSYQQC